MDKIKIEIISDQLITIQQSLEGAGNHKDIILIQKDEYPILFYLLRFYAKLKS